VDNLKKTYNVIEIKKLRTNFEIRYSFNKALTEYIKSLPRDQQQTKMEIVRREDGSTFEDWFRVVNDAALAKIIDFIKANNLKFKFTNLSIEEIEKLKVEFKQRLTRGEEALKARAKDLDVSNLEIPNMKIQPYEYQKQAAVFFEKADGKAILGDSPGVGKTMSAIAYAVKNNLKTLVVCPASLKLNWKNEILRFTNEKAFIYKYKPKKKSKEVLFTKEESLFHIINYEALETFIKLSVSHRCSNYQCGWKETNTKKMDLKPKVTNGLIVGVEIDDYDNFTKELFEEGGSYDEEMSRHDLERLYNLLCFKIVAGQTDENRKFAPERSWGKLKTALNVYLMEKLKLSRAEAYKVIVNDLVSPAGTLAPVIGDALLAYRTIREQEVNKKAARAKRVEHIEIPREALFFTDQYEELDVKKSALAPFWIEKNYVGRENEENFVKFLESPKNKSVEWWHKNGDTGSEHFSISYYNPDENKEKLFYPDWIVKTKGGVLIVDTKAGITAESNDTKYKAEALQKWIKGKKGFDGGIVVKDGPNGWKINRNSAYSYDSSLKGWTTLDLS
jgi:hypothetical protein